MIVADVVATAFYTSDSATCLQLFALRVMQSPQRLSGHVCLLWEVANQGM